jgi:hypothetical protein
MSQQQLSPLSPRRGARGRRARRARHAVDSDPPTAPERRPLVREGPKPARDVPSWGARPMPSARLFRLSETMNNIRAECR